MNRGAVKSTRNFDAEFRKRDNSRMKKNDVKPVTSAVHLDSKSETKGRSCLVLLLSSS